MAMTRIVDIETSAEAIQEDEELIEAVQAVVGSAAVSVTSQIMSDVNSFFEPIRTFLETLFPRLVDYQKDAALVWDDLEHICVFVILAFISFLILAPQQGKRKKNSYGGGGGARSGVESQRRRSLAPYYTTSTDSNASPGFGGDGEMDSANNSLNSQTSWFPLLNEESDEERFRRIYPSLYDECKYFKLLLPSDCQLVEDTVASKLRQQQQQKQLAEAARQKHRDVNIKGKKGRDKTTLERASIDEADDPAQRLHFYFRQFMVLVRSLFTYDYVSAAWTIWLWLQGIQKHRRTNSDTSLSPQESTGQDVVAADSLLESEIKYNSEQTTDVFGGSSDTNEGEEELGKRDEKLSFDDETEEKCDEQHNQVSCERSVIQNNQLIAQRLQDSEPESNDKDKLASEEGKEDSASSAGQSAVNKSLDGLLVNTVSFLQGHLNKFVGNSSEDAQQAVSSEKQDSATIETQSTATEFGADHGQSPSSGTTLMTNNTVQIINDCKHDGGDSVTIPEQVQNPRATSKEAAMTSSTELKLRTSPWYFFESANSVESLKRMWLDVPVPDKNGYILGDEYLPDDRCTPLLVFVNSRSGPQQGQFLITQLRRLLNPIQVWDLADGRPEPVLESFCALTRLRILVCGGDGTVSWIISALDSLNLKRKWPPIAILPLGTGNDLARVHGWGAGYNNESLISILEQISESYISVLDRWELTIEDEKKRVTTKNFFNYFSFGIDAELALQVHFLRERRPEWFFSRFVNKAWYGVFGAEESIKGKSLNVRRDITLYADGVLVPLPTDSQGIIILNIDSYAGGVPLWSHGVKEGIIRRSRSMGSTCYGARRGSVHRIDSSDDLPVPLTREETFARVTACDLPSSCQDGFLDIVSVRGLVHLGQIKVGIGRAQRLCQCREIKVIVKKKVAVQIDGEPWRQDKCILRIKRKPDPALMLHRSADDGGIETEMSKLLEWAEERNLIDGHVHSVLMKEFSRRIETKTRQRRFRSQEHTVIENLKRAIGSTGAISTLGHGTTRNSFMHSATSLKQFHHHQHSSSAHPLSYAPEGIQQDLVEERGEAASLRRYASPFNMVWGNDSTSGGIAF